MNALIRCCALGCCVLGLLEVLIFAEVVGAVRGPQALLPFPAHASER